jgi:hypothetical protein
LGAISPHQTAVKLHLLLDHDDFLPCYAVITEGKQPEIGVARQLRYEPGTLLAIDRGYLDYGWFADLSQKGVYFITRMKDNADYIVLEERELPHRKGLLRDQVICFTGRHGRDRNAISAASSSMTNSRIESWCF